jgi:hypothetical protein
VGLSTLAFDLDLDLLQLGFGLLTIFTYTLTFTLTITWTWTFYFQLAFGGSKIVRRNHWHTFNVLPIFMFTFNLTFICP